MTSSPSAHPGRARTIARFRLWLRRYPALHLGYRVLIGVLGAAIIIGGLILVPLPGPGWLIVFVGIAVLGTEFRWARRVGRWVRRRGQRVLGRWRAHRAARGRARPGGPPAT